MAAPCGAAGLESRVETLRNRFFLIRHGEAECNVEHILVSEPDVGINKYGLTDKGRQQAEEAATTFKTLLSSEINLAERLLVLSSDFKRTRETAEIIHTKLGIKEPIKLELRLRERGLGSLHLTDFSSVGQMWALDEADPTHNEFGVESVMEMVVRLSHLIQELNKEHSNRVIILVSHGDPCQCLHAMFMGVSPNEFRKLPGITNCEIKELIEVDK